MVNPKPQNDQELHEKQKKMELIYQGTTPSKLKIQRVDIVYCYRYLGWMMGHKLNLHSHIDETIKKVTKDYFFIKGSSPLMVAKTHYKNLYKAIIESVMITFGIKCLKWNMKISGIERTI